MLLRQSSIFLLLLVLLSILFVSGKPSRKDAKERKKGKFSKDDKELHRFKYRCNSKGVCQYKFTLTIPEKSANGTAQTSALLTDNKEVKQLKNELEDLKLFIENITQTNAREIEGLKTQLDDLQKQVKRGKRNQRKFSDQLDDIMNKTIEGGGNDQPISDTFVHEVKKNFSNISVRVKNVERLYYGYASDGKYIYIMRPKTPHKLMATVVGQDCAIMRKRGLRESGLFMIQPVVNEKSTQFYAYCDMYTDGGGWTVIQRRQGGVENFNRGWEDYKVGFGDSKENGEFWLGLEKIYQLNQYGNNEIRFDMWDFHGKHKYAVYKEFRLANETDDYRIEVGRYQGTAGDAFHYANVKLQQNRQQFSTLDNDNDAVTSQNCAKQQKGAWWYQHCGVANLNGNFYQGGVHLSDEKDGIIWQPWHLEESLRRTEIKIRPGDF